MVLLARSYQGYGRQKYALGAPMERSAGYRTTDGRPRVQVSAARLCCSAAPQKRRRKSTVLMAIAFCADLDINH
jgi:hypothetical protein